jgi:hypothetical protein
VLILEGGKTLFLDIPYMKELTPQLLTVRCLAFPQMYAAISVLSLSWVSDGLLDCQAKLDLCWCTRSILVVPRRSVREPLHPSGPPSGSVPSSLHMCTFRCLPTTPCTTCKSPVPGQRSALCRSLIPRYLRQATQKLTTRAKQCMSFVAMAPRQTQ